MDGYLRQIQAVLRAFEKMLCAGAHFHKANVPARVHVYTMQQPAICIESFSDRVDPPETMKKKCE